MNSDFIVLRDLYTRTQALKGETAEIGVTDDGKVVDSTQQPEGRLGYLLSFVVTHEPVTEENKAKVRAVFNRCREQVRQFDIRDREVSLHQGLSRQLAGTTPGEMASELKILLDSEWGRTQQLMCDIEVFVKSSLNGLDEYNRTPMDIDDPGVDEELRSTFRIMEYNQQKLVERIEDRVNRSAYPEAVRAELKQLYERLKDEKVGAGQEEGVELAQSNLKLRLINRMLNVLPDLAVAPIPLPEVRVIDRDANRCLEGIEQYINGVMANVSQKGLRGAYLAKVSREAATHITQLIERSHTTSGQKVFIMEGVKADHIEKLKKANDRIQGGLTPLIIRLELLYDEAIARNKALEACPPVAVVRPGWALDLNRVAQAQAQADLIVRHLKEGGVGHEQGWCEVLAKTVMAYPFNQRSRVRFDLALEIEQRVSAQLGDPGLAKGVFNVLYHGAGVKQTQSVKMRGLSDPFQNLRCLSDEVQALRRKLPGVSLVDVSSLLRAYSELVLHHPDAQGAPLVQARVFIEELRGHFTQTRQDDGFADLYRGVEEEVVMSTLKANPTDIVLRFLSGIPRNADNTNGRRDLLRRVLTHILNNGLVNRDSIHGHTRDLVNSDHLLYLDMLSKADLMDWLDVRRADINEEALLLSPEKLKDNLEFEVRDFCHSSPGYRKLKDQLLRLDLDQLERRTSQGLELPEDVVKAVVAARKLMLDIDLGIARRWGVEALKSPDYWPSRDDHEAFLKLERIKFLKSPGIFRAQRQWLVDQHNKHKKFPNVVIEGAGPTGMMSALCQYQAGAKVQIVEKRNLQYDRVQVVRLDPKWMDMLRFYIGEEFDQLFTDPAHPSEVEGKGIIREDGFGEIVTAELEKALQRELGKVEALNDLHGHLNLTAQCELREIREPQGGLGYTAVAHRLDTDSPKTLNNVDLVICAGGKSSAIRKRYLTAETVTEEAQYGVCTWKGEGLKDSHFGTFADFRQMIVVDAEFISSAIFHMEKQVRRWQRNQIISADVAGELERKIQVLEGQLLALQGQDRAVQSRCFENRKLIYIGMEIPAVLQDSLKEMTRYLEAQNVGRAQTKEIITSMGIGWFEAVAGQYDLNARVGATEQHIDRKFAATFGVSQHRLQQNMTRNQKDGRRVYVTAAGDANCSPHFMRYSGLTGAREHILQDQAFTEKLAAGTTPEQMESYQDDLEEKSRNTADFVIGRGRIFLNPLDRPQKEYFDA